MLIRCVLREKNLSRLLGGQVTRLSVAQLKIVKAKKQSILQMHHITVRESSCFRAERKALTRCSRRVATFIAMQLKKHVRTESSPFLRA